MLKHNRTNERTNEKLKIKKQLTMHNVLKSSTDWKQVEKKFKEENKLKIKWEKKMNSIQIEKREWQRDKEAERKK